MSIIGKVKRGSNDDVEEIVRETCPFCETQNVVIHDESGEMKSEVCFHYVRVNWNDGSIVFDSVE